MTHCWLCGASEIKSPNSKYTYYGKILGKRVQKTIRVCNCCSAMRADEDIREEVAEIFGWDYNEEATSERLYHRNFHPTPSH